MKVWRILTLKSTRHFSNNHKGIWLSNESRKQPRLNGLIVLETPNKRRTFSVKSARSRMMTITTLNTSKIKSQSWLDKNLTSCNFKRDWLSRRDKTSKATSIEKWKLSQTSFSLLMKTRRTRTLRFITKKHQETLIDMHLLFFLMKMYTFRDTLTLKTLLRISFMRSMLTTVTWLIYTSVR